MELVKVENNGIVINPEFIKQYKEFKKIQLEMELKEKQFKKDLKELMEEMGKTSILKDGFSVTYKKATTSKRIDSKRLKEELPDIYEEYTKESEVASSITIKVE